MGQRDKDGIAAGRIGFHTISQGTIDLRRHMPEHPYRSCKEAQHLSLPPNALDDLLDRLGGLKKASWTGNICKHSSLYCHDLTGDYRSLYS